MTYLHNETKFNIQTLYHKMTPIEQCIADFFIQNSEKIDFSSRNISNILYVSEASLSRFAKKCGYKGYREFISFYEKDLENEKNEVSVEKNINVLARNVYKNYQFLLQETFALIDKEQIRRVSYLLNTHNQILVYGIGSSGLAAEELQSRFMRIGLNIYSITSGHKMLMSAALAKEGTLVIAISLSGKTKEVADSIHAAKQGGATVVLITANPKKPMAEFCDEVLQVAQVQNLDLGTKVSPQFSTLVMVDVLYSYYSENDPFFQSQKTNKTLSSIKEERL